MNRIAEFIHEVDEHRVPDEKRRELLLAATGVMGAAGLTAAGVPFVASLAPPDAVRAAGGPVDVDIGNLLPGELRTVEWRGRPVWLMRRTDEMVRALQASDSVLADPLSKRSVQPVSCVNATRSASPDLFVAVGVCTHLGCSPRLVLDDQPCARSCTRPAASSAPAMARVSTWPGGW